MNLRDKMRAAALELADTLYEIVREHLEQQVRGVTEDAAPPRKARTRAAGRPGKAPAPPPRREKASAPPPPPPRAEPGVRDVDLAGDVIAFVRAHPGCRYAEIHAALPRTESVLRAAIVEARNRGEVRLEGSRIKSRYFPTQGSPSTIEAEGEPPAAGAADQAGERPADSA
jgi:hypothetical protein